MTATLAIDLGGTKTLVALVDGARVLARRKLDTDRRGHPDDWLAAIGAAAQDWRGRYDQIGMTVTGLVADGHWRPLNPETLSLPASGYPLVSRAQDLFGLPVALSNDAQAAAWGEYAHGAGAGRDMAFMTISTGIGVGFVLNGRLLTGRNGLAGHAGQMIAMPDGDDDPVENNASGRWIAREVGAPDARTVFTSATPGGDAVIARSAARVARMCRNIQVLLAPDVILIGGGVGTATGYMTKVRDALATLDDIRRPHLEAAALGGDAGIIGIAALARSAAESQPHD